MTSLVLLWSETTSKPRQGGTNSINMKRIFKIGWKALGDFRNINYNLSMADKVQRF